MSLFERFLPTAKIADEKIRFWSDLFLLLLIFVPLYFLWLGNRPFATPDEARYVEIPREILASNNWITPRLNGVKYFEKPPLLYWILALFQMKFGITEVAMRVPVVCFGLSGILGVYAFGSKVLNRLTGFISAFILGTTILWFCLSRLIILDMAVSVFITFSLFCFYLAIEEKNKDKKRRFFFALFSLCCALGVMTKGIMVLVVVGAILIIWLTLSKNWACLLPLYLPTNLIIFFLVVSPWHILASLQNPEFFHKYFIVEHFLRYTTTVHGRYQPCWFFMPILLFGFLPWTGFLFQAIRSAIFSLGKPKLDETRAVHQKSLMLLLLIWPAFIFLFFSVSNSKLIPYILPIFPPLALLVGKWLAEILIKNQRSLRPFFIFSVLLSIGAFLVPFYSTQIGVRELITEKAALVPYIHMLGVIFAAMAICTIPINLAYMNMKIRFIGMGVLGTFLTIIVIFTVPIVQKPSLKALIDYTKSTIKIEKNTAENNPQTKTNLSQNVFGCYKTYFQDLPVYTKKIITVVDYLGELDFGAAVEDTSAWMIKNDQFLKYLKNLQKHHKRFWLFIKNESIRDFKHNFPEIPLEIKRCENGLCVGTCLEASAPAIPGES